MSGSKATVQAIKGSPLWRWLQREITKRDFDREVELWHRGAGRREELKDYLGFVGDEEYEAWVDRGEYPKRNGQAGPCG